MTVEVRLFASLRDAAGVNRLEVEAEGLGQLLDDLRGRYGEPFVSRLSASSVVVDGEPVDPAVDRSLRDVREVALLPPFSGG